MNKATEIVLVPLEHIKLNSHNLNKHSEEQIQRLAKIIEYQGFREPVIISNRSGVLIAGEGRYLAAKKLGLKEIPATKQDFDSDEQEYNFGVSTNAIALWSDLDLSQINKDLETLGPIDIDLLGLENFKVDMSEHGEMGDDSICPKCKRAYE